MVSRATHIRVRGINNYRIHTHAHTRERRMWYRHAASYTSWKQWAHGLATSVGDKPGPLTCPLCYLYWLHHAWNTQNLVGVSHAHLDIGLFTWFSCHNFWTLYQCSTELVGTTLLRVVAENVVTDGQTDRWNDRPSTTTLTVHARRGLIKLLHYSRNTLT